MASLDSVSIAIFLGAVLVMAGILSSLLALRFGAPLLLVFLLIGMLAGDAGPGQLSFNDVRTTYLVGSVALALILFDGGLRTKFQSIRTVLAPSMVLATVGVLVTALVAAPAAKYALDLNWTEALLVGAVVCRNSIVSVRSIGKSRSRPGAHQVAHHAAHRAKLIRSAGRFPQGGCRCHRYNKPARSVWVAISGTLSLSREMGWRSTVATIRMQLQVFA